MNIISQLPKSVANQIAAGEVIQRPSSIVKELIENSIDAKSKNIKVIIKDAGKQSITVIDDGIGMTKQDSVKCFERHSTSKLSTAEDLFIVKTMGFRGEALASIAAGADGLLIEIHPRPDEALCDGPQALTPIELVELGKKVSLMADVVGRSLTL